ncbi:GNAT family N-acetyltransferase [Fictibacillus barbaricus]|uniref:L-amino acid N-acyltransferase YncA n=1 Tax=Fictibacillus barbaricus TaxID=182136 RepID=A0ABU1U0J9_9BACL|nr:GNAT family N-acetyltransferase [Fictibacillus barbaricus]MDR7072983.1 L-amino acid N-acyltransferase YncA [Fictibacillus barbaricus]
MNIRRAAASDAVSIAEVQVKSWQSSYKGLVDENYLQSMSISERAVRWKEWLAAGPSHIMYVLGEDNEVAGFVSGGNIRSAHPYDSEIYAIYLLKEVQRKGYGTLLMKKFAEAMHKQGKKSMIVWVLKDNPSKQAYLSLGAKKIDKERITIGKQELFEECYAWENLPLF